MITINLLPISTFKQRLKGRIFLTALALILVIGLAAMASVKMIILDTNLAELSQQESNLKQELQRIKNQVTEADSQTKLTVRKWKQLVAITDLEERRRDQTRLLSELERLVPKDSAWLTGLDHSKGMVTINGISKDKDTISAFLSRLQTATFLDRNTVYPGSISQSLRINNILLTTFTITARTKFPNPTILNNGLEEYNLPSAKQFAELVKIANASLAEGLLPE